MGPGPSDVHPRVLAAVSRPSAGHLDLSFCGMVDEVKEMLRQVFRTNTALTLPVSGPGMTAMKTCFVNLLEESDIAM